MFLGLFDDAIQNAEVIQYITKWQDEHKGEEKDVKEGKCGLCQHTII
jgi:hypothetical protein